VIKVLPQGELLSKGLRFIDMEFCDFNLKQFNDTNWTSADAFYHDFFPKQAWNIMMQIAGGLVFIHAKGFIHRDLKPQNGSLLDPSIVLICVVLFSKMARKWKISDFGFSSEGSSTSLQTSNTRRGTNGYRAPELISKYEISQQGDIWALGCILYELVTGNQRFQSDGEIFVYTDSQPMDLPRDDIMSNESRTAISNCLQETIRVNPLSRSSASELLERFRQHYDQMSHIPTLPNEEIESQQSTDPPVHAQNASVDGTAESQRSASTRSHEENAEVDRGTESHQTIPAEMPGWIVVNATVNKPNTRFATYMSDRNRSHFRVAIWKTDPLEVLLCFWPESELSYELSQYSNIDVSLAFTDDGKYLAVCFAQLVKIFDAQTAEEFKSLTLPIAAQAMSIAIQSDAKRIAVSKNGDSLNPGVNSSPTLRTLPSQEISIDVDVVTTPRRSNQVALIYDADGDYLFVIFKPDQTEQTIIGYWFELRDNTMVRRIPFPSEQYRNGPLSSLQTGIIVPSSHPYNSPYTTLSLCERNEQRTFKIGADELICGTTTDSFLLLTSDSMRYYDPQYWEPDWDAEYGIKPGGWHWLSTGVFEVVGVKKIFLWTWDGKDELPMCVGWLQSTSAIRLDEVKALARTQQGVILVTKKNSVPILATIAGPPRSRIMTVSFDGDD
jgi:serine/threonine protein kinase